ncbi:interference hedgehog-like isoform X2 [Centruroides vittatus]|uniref:interference hedgehog-like isoform X2 n=1 Tax=Centruroides vittatus TaxID=120091 RepID=UPI003510C22E
MKESCVILMFWLFLNLSSVKYVYSNFLDLEFQSEPLTVMVTPRDGRVVFRCSASPSSAVITWLWNGEPLTQESEGGFNVGHHKLVVNLPKKNREEIDLYDNSKIQCLAHHKKRALLSLPASLIIGKLDAFPPQDDINMEIVRGNTAVIPCHPPPSVPIAVTEFHFQDTVISRSTERYHLMPSGNLQIFGVQPNNSGSYRCDVINPFLNEKRMGQHQTILSVIEEKENKPSSFLIYPINQTNVIMGSNVTLECVVQGFPIPNITWEKQNGYLPRGRHLQVGGNLVLLNVVQEDEGTYICHAFNGIGERISASTNIFIHEIPHLLSSPDDKQIIKGENITVECIAKGYPKPHIEWFHNGKKLVTNSRIHVKGGLLNIKKSLLKDSGIYQCFAINALGSTYGVFVIDIHDSSKISREWGSDEEMEEEEEVKMMPPSKPEVTRLSDNSVMVRWNVPQNDGLPIIFFRVQYKEVGKKGNVWITIDEDIAAHLHAHAVSGLKTGGRYRFRIAAVYANQDNKMGPSSAKFILHKDPPVKKPESGPTITEAEAVSQSAIMLHWKYEEVDSIPVEGFFIYYRATHSAGEYSQVIVLGSNTRSHILSHLLPETPYDIKMQCFNIYGTSDFSNIYTCKTLPSQITDVNNYHNKPQQDRSTTNDGSKSVATKSVESSKLIYIILGSVLGIMLLVLLIFMVLCIQKQQRQRRHLQTNQTTLELQVKPDTNGHIPSTNGFLKGKEKVNISVNPLNEYLKDDDPKLSQTAKISSNNNEMIPLNNLERNDRQDVSVSPRVENATECDPMLPTGATNDSSPG